MLKILLSSFAMIVLLRELAFSMKVRSEMPLSRHSLLSRVLKSSRRIFLKLKMKGGKRPSNSRLNLDLLSQPKQNLQLGKKLLAKVLHRLSKRGSVSSL